jgi:putative transcriptional regulator
MQKRLFDELVTSIREAGAIQRGQRKAARRFELADSKVQAVREKAGLSQAQFARLLNVSVKTLQNWEQARRRPTGPAKALLRIVEREPAAALRALARSDAS